MLRKLEKKDVPYMLEWMHDPEINCIFSVDFASFTETMAEAFVERSFDEENQHFAVVNEKDEYQGTISLKNISVKDRNAEYAVVFRKQAHGTGISGVATEEILDYAFHVLKLERVYLNVLEDNRRARAFYKKMGFAEEGVFRKHKWINGKFHDLYWFGMLKDSYENR